MKKKYYNNHLIQKKWSQVFLHDKKIIDDIIKAIDLKKKQKIIEIGPGLGALTTQIANVVDSLILIERDSNLVNHLIKRFNKRKIKIFNQDVLKVNFFTLSKKSEQKIRIIGNLPYNIATKLIIHLFKYIHIIYDMHFMLQKEVAIRILSNPNTKEYGRLSIITQYHCKVIPILEILPTSFIPVPQVNSMLIRLIPHINSPYPQTNIEQLSLITKLAFNQRRKMIRNSLSKFFNILEIKPQEIDLTLRAENITIHQYCTLTIMLNENLKYL